MELASPSVCEVETQEGVDFFWELEEYVENELETAAGSDTVPEPLDAWTRVVRCSLSFSRR